MKNCIVINHPLIQRDLTVLRDKKTRSYEFRNVLDRAARNIAYEVTRDLPVMQKDIFTPLERTKGIDIAPEIVLVPILRAGLGFVNGFVDVLPKARVGHIGLFRDEETLKPVDYYFKVPKNLKNALIYLLDPMLATGGSASAAVTFLKKRGARTIQSIHLVAAPEGVRTLQKAHPDVRIYTCALDRSLNAYGYIMPGLGDAGDRIFGTEDPS